MAHAAEVELADVTSSKVGDAEAQIHRKVEELNQELRSGEKAAEGGGEIVEANEYSLAFDANGGSGTPPASMKAYEGTDVVLPVTALQMMAIFSADGRRTMGQRFTSLANPIRCFTGYHLEGILVSDAYAGGSRSCHR